MQQSFRPDPKWDRILWILIALNVGVFILWHQVGTTRGGLRFMMDHFLVSGSNVTSGRIWTLLTSCFSHRDATHLLVNMLVLWVFGRDILGIIGPGRFIRLYVIGGILASIGHVGIGLMSLDAAPALGASGSVMAIAVVFAALFPRRTLLLNFFIPVPAALAVAGYIALDVFGAFQGGTGIAHGAHLGGAAYGAWFWWWTMRPALKKNLRR